MLIIKNMENTSDIHAIAHIIVDNYLFHCSVDFYLQYMLLVLLSIGNVVAHPQRLVASVQRCCAINRQCCCTLTPSLRFNILMLRYQSAMLLHTHTFLLHQSIDVVLSIGNVGAHSHRFEASIY